jgi:tRNA uridine 5-carboxymethylaminomethyl modification enzyme
MKTDIIVIGGGHAGIEAACIASIKDLRVILITNHLDLIGQMSCNPSIGGVAKGNIVREIDALGGVMGHIADETGIHFKMLNTSKGAAVWGNRAQADKVAYRKYARNILEKREKITILQGLAKQILVKNTSVIGVILDSGEKIEAKAIICAMGTFLNGTAHIGLTSFPCGRLGEPPSLTLSESIQELGIKAGRLKTGTSPRIDGRTIQFEKCEEQKGDEKPWPFSFSTIHEIVNKTSCWISKTNKETHKIILDNLDRSPLYTGKIKSIGPRYCPSIEDKVIRFGERDGHTLFLEPESLEHTEYYLNGLSTSLPFDVQIKMVQSVKGLENASIVRPGYGIEYDFFYPQQLLPTLESKCIKNLFFAGQINGTSGYEEAACQGLIAGINAAQKIKGDEPLIISRDTAYIGVLIDDLVSKGTSEPYRMFTSRAEYRLLLRQDNCDERLMPIAHALKLIDDSTYSYREKKWEEKERLRKEIYSTSIKAEQWNAVSEIKIEQTCKASELLKRPEVEIDAILTAMQKEKSIDRFVKTTISWDIKYSGFVEKEHEEIEKMKILENTTIPDNFEYTTINGLLTESKNKLQQIKPKTLGQASRVSGVTPADITIIAIYLKKRSFT